MKPKRIEECGCCDVGVPPTPEEIKNRPALSKIGYRVGTFSSFRQAMIEAIATKRELRGWTVRSSDDYAIALFEMWAYLSDIITFYQERIANEAFLRTALLSESVRCLVATLDYKPEPGMAATTHLAFTLEGGKQVQISVGLAVQSVPGQDEQPQKFETVEDVAAHAHLNLIPILPRPEVEEPFDTGSTGGVLTSDASELSPGDKLVVFDGTRFEKKEVVALTQDGNRTILKWTPAIQGGLNPTPKVFKYVDQMRLFGHNAPLTYLTYSIDSDGNITWTEHSLEPPAMDDPTALDPNALYLDARYDDLKPGTSLLLVYRDGYKFTQRLKVSGVSEAAVKMGPLQDTVTRLSFVELIGINSSLTTNLRHATLYELSGPEITFWNHYYPDAINKDESTVYVPLAHLESLEKGRTLILDDEEEKPQVVTVTGAAPVDADGDGVDDHLSITFTPALARPLATATARLYGNVVKTTHGETMADEVLGSGNASMPFQSFTLRKKPVTFVPEPTALHGAANTLGVRVGGVLWHEVSTLYRSKDDERVYTTNIDSEGVMTVRCGDGVTGARLQTGVNNVTATYRQGLGRDGNVKAKSLTTLLDRPVGLKGVTNPWGARGGVNSEDEKDSKSKAPDSVRTFGRIVSLRDFEYAAKEFVGVAKARASWVWEGEGQVVHLTVAGDNGAAVDGEVKSDLLTYLNASRDPNRQLYLESYMEVPIRVEALIKVDPDYVPEDVQAAARKALQDYFAFDNQDLGQSIHLSDIYQVLQNVKGVVAVDINRLQYKGITTAGPLQKHLRILPTQLAVIEGPAEDSIVDVGME